MPSMLKSDQVVYIAADDLDYDGGLSKAIYTGSAKLWQAETSVQAETLALDNQSGDLTRLGIGDDQHDARAARDGQEEEGARAFDRDGEGLQVRRIGAAGDLYRRRPPERAAGRHDGGQDRALPEGVGRRARSGRGLRQTHAARTEPQDDRRAHDLHHRERDLRRHRAAGRDCRRMRTRDERPQADVREGDRHGGRGRRRTGPHADQDAPGSVSY